jgi:hypothetical protein
VRGQKAGSARWGADDGGEGVGGEVGVEGGGGVEEGIGGEMGG